jgi:hypothetical protein
MPSAMSHFMVKNVAVVYSFFTALAVVMLRRFRPYLANYWAFVLQMGKDQPLLVAPIIAMVLDKTCPNLLTFRPSDSRVHRLHGEHPVGSHQRPLHAVLLRQSVPQVTHRLHNA